MHHHQHLSEQRSVWSCVEDLHQSGWVSVTDNSRQRYTLSWPRTTTRMPPAKLGCTSTVVITCWIVLKGSSYGCWRREKNWFAIKEIEIKPHIHIHTNTRTQNNYHQFCGNGLLALNRRSLEGEHGVWSIQIQKTRTIGVECLVVMSSESFAVINHACRKRRSKWELRLLLR